MLDAARDMQGCSDSNLGRNIFCRFMKNTEMNEFRQLAIPAATTLYSAASAT